MDLEAALRLIQQERDQLRAQLAAERQGALAREEALESAQWFARLAWQFIVDSCVGDEIEADIGALDSPEREMYLRWCIVHSAAEQRPWLE